MVYRHCCQVVILLPSSQQYSFFQVTGGEGDYLRLSYFFVLDSGDFELTSSDLPSDRTNHRCSVVETEERGAEIVLAGGNNGFATNGVLETVDIFDPREVATKGHIPVKMHFFFKKSRFRVCIAPVLACPSRWTTPRASRTKTLFW